MAIINFPTKGAAKFEEVEGYRIIPNEIVDDYFDHARGVGTDIYVIKLYRKYDSVTLSKGVIPDAPQIKNVRELIAHQTTLITKLDDISEGIEEKISEPTDIWQECQNGYATLFVKSKDGYMSCGWYDHAKTKRKGLKMAAFMIYALGFINSETDPDLWTVTYKYLPYDSELGRSDIADEIIIKGLKNLVVGNT